MAIEGEARGARFDAVIQIGRRAVIVDVADLFGPDACFLHGQRHRVSRLFAALFETHAMIGLAGGGITDDFTVDLRAALEGVFAFFENEEPRAFAEHESAAVARERPRAALGFAIPLRGE